MTFHHAQLANGLTIIGEANPAARSVALGFFVQTGARDEAHDVSGVTHFLEHMIFKGTPRRSAQQVNEDFDRIGASYNAFTSEENTVFHAALLPEYLPQAVDILADILRPSLRQEDFDMEKNVIIEEIGMYDDQPLWSTYDAAKQLFFKNHPLGQSILGTKASITALKRDQMQEYFDRRYVAPNITVALAGAFAWPDALNLIERQCAGWPAGATTRAVAPAPRTKDLKVMPSETVVQEHAFLLSSGPPADSELRYAAEVLANALGDDTGSRLYWALVDPGLAESASCSFHEYQGAGAFYTYLCSDADQTQANLGIVLGLLAALQAEGLSDEEIALAKSKLASRIVRGNERPMGRMQSLGFNWIYLKRQRTVDEDLAAIEAVDRAQMLRLLDEHPVNEPTIVALGPLKALRRP
jgi:predicted Zn-dependent peptidase